jgi:CRISPR-associated protein Cas4
MDTDEDNYHAIPQTRGKAAHQSIDNKAASTKKTDIMALSVCSNRLKIIGKIDLYRQDTQQLIERKYELKQIYQGQLYQLWSQYFCMSEMGYSVKSIAFYEISRNRMIPIDMPGVNEYNTLLAFINLYRNFNPSMPITINQNKCIHCVYCNLCDKINTDNVYT